MLSDAHGRIHNYLRISLTDACNFRCFYCMPDEEVDVTPQSKLMSAAEIFEMAKVFAGLGVTKIRLTGGEPLVRKDAAQIMQLLATLPVQLTLTTNGVLVDRFVQHFKDAGIRSVNVSLDTLDPLRFMALTKRDSYRQVRNNIDLLLRHEFSVKVNVVVMKGINHHEVNDFIMLGKDHPLHIRFIEFMPFNQNQWMSERVYSYRQILDNAAEEFDFIKIRDERHDTTKKYKVPGHAGTFAVISTMTAPFCSTCNRLRLTADGKIKNCLFSKTETDLLGALRRGEDIRSLIINNLKAKEVALGGQLLPDFEKIDSNSLQNRSMIRIGG